MKRTLVMLVVLGIGISASAELTYDFDDGVNPFGVGAITSIESVSGPNSLYLGGDDFVELILPAEYIGQELTVSRKGCDEGRWVTSGNEMGPRWGVGSGTQGSANAPGGVNQYVAASIINLGYLPSGQGYGRNTTEDFLGQFSGNTWFSASWFDYDDGRVAGTDPHMSATGDGSAGSGVWYEWTFETTTDGLVTWTRVGSPTTYTDDDAGGGTSAPIDRVLLWGGNTNDLLTGVYIDDITVIPEPATIGLLLLGTGAALWRRRRGQKKFKKELALP